MSTPCVRIRALANGEEGPVLDVFAGLRSRSRELRFMAPKHHLTSTDLCHLTRVDGRDRVALVAEGPDGRAVGIARFVRDPRDHTVADVAVAVIDDWQRQGVGAMLTRALVEHARAAAVRRFSVLMLRDNEGAARLLRHVGGDVQPRESDDHSAEYELTLETAAPVVRPRSRSRCLTGGRPGGQLSRSAAIP